jgi:riboflavin biosynthesis pyrimidine reductase
MVVTADGRAALGGKTKAISSEADRILFRRLREQVDAVMAGTGTIAIERYGPLVRDVERRARREARGLAPQPLGVTASRSLELPVQVPLFQDPDSRLVVLTSSDSPAPDAPAQVILLRVPALGGTGEIDFAAGLERLRREHGVRSVLLEGGPTLLAAMVEAGLVDELFLTIAPVVAGVPEPSLYEGTPPPQPVPLRLLSVLEDENFLFLRYATGSSGD